MPNVVRFVLDSARDLYVPGAGQFHDGVLDVDANNLTAIARARYLTQPYRAVELGIVDSATPPPALPAAPGSVTPTPDPYSQYLTPSELPAALEPLVTGDNVFAAALSVASVAAVQDAIDGGDIEVGGALVEQDGEYAAGKLYVGETNPGDVPDGSVWINPAGNSAAKIRDVAYAMAVLQDAPAGFWKLNETAGLPQDASGKGNHATSVSGSPTYLGDAMTFHRANSERISIPDANTLDLGDTWTIEAWVRPTDTQTSKAVFSKGNNAPALSLESGDGYRNNPLVKKSQMTNLRGANTMLTDGEWHQVVATKAPGAVAIHVYVDGVLDEQAYIPSTEQTVSTAQPVNIGAEFHEWDGGAENYFDGDIRWVSCYPIPLTAQQIANHYQAGI